MDFGKDKLTSLTSMEAFPLGSVRITRDVATVTVNIYCGGLSTMPTATFGPITLNSHMRGATFNNDFWKVADIEIDTLNQCNVVDLADSAGPAIVSTRQAKRTR